MNSRSPQTAPVEVERLAKIAERRAISLEWGGSDGHANNAEIMEAADWRTIAKIVRASSEPTREEGDAGVGDGLFRKKPVVIYAVRFDGTNRDRIEAFYGERLVAALRTDGSRGPAIVIPTLEGDHRAEPGDWIIRGVKGEFYPCKPDIFALTYEPVTPSESAPEGSTVVTKGTEEER